MKVVHTDIWEIWKETPASVICIPTNGCVRPNGTLIMGKGMALDAAKRYPNLAEDFGKVISATGNVPHLLLVQDGKSNRLITNFPTKHGFVQTKEGRVPGWSLPSDIKLIERSAEGIVRIANMGGIRDVFLPAVGCGLGGLKWEDVKALLEKHLDERFTVCFRGPAS